ncbi:MAG: zinc-dependent metalloprotease, partial [Salinibacterium sp.]|nr:zinc-dependent metalloprotease [Salinibacterium sp.]
MADDSRDDSGASNPEDEFRDMLKDFLAGNTDLDPAKLVGAAGLPNDPETVAQLISQLQSAMQNTTDGINWDLALQQATGIAERGTVVSLPAERSQLEQALHVASLWLDEATAISEPSGTPRLMSRQEWVTATMPVWTQLAEPVANSIANSLTDVLTQSAGEDGELDEMIQGASKLMRNVGGTLFAMQLGQVVGQLAGEVVSGGDIGIP